LEENAECDHDNLRAVDLTGGEISGGVRRMAQPSEEFRSLVTAVLKRFLAQNGVATVADVELAECGARLWALVVERGLPRPLAPDERGASGEMSDEECSPLVARVAGGTSESLLRDAARQLVKACFYPEFRSCRNSFVEVDATGACRRQDVSRVRKRVSGTHCVDCPHWIALEPSQHEKFLTARWRAGAEEFRAHREIFLPEDFRALRRWLHGHARSAGRH
jgi:hypothetical protein